MADRDDQSNLPPIPDGGLADTMPDWLRRPPAWRALPDREIALPEPEGTGDLPEPDESVIDPRELLNDDDLPGWLRTLGRARPATPPVAGEPVEVAPGGIQPVAGAEASESGQPAPATSSRFVPAAPPVSAAARPAPAVPPSGGTLPAAPVTPTAQVRAWQGGWVVALLAALLVVAIAVIIVLAL
jgi:hypothetical protein